MDDISITSKQENNEPARNQPATVFEALSHRIRRRVIILLHENVEMSYTEMLEALRIDEGLLNFHLRKIRRFLRQTTNSTYILSPRGESALKLLRIAETELGETPPERTLNGSTLPQLLVGRRVAATFIDIAIIFLASALFLDEHITGLMLNIIALTATPTDFIIVLYDIYHFHTHLFFIGFLLSAVMEAYNGQTLGKYVMRIRVVKIDDRKVGLIPSLIRNTGKVFLFPFDILVGVAFYLKHGYLKFFDYYTETKVIRII